MITVLIAGIGGASLGTEIAKALRLAGGYRIVGCDISKLAYGHFAGLCDRTAVVPSDGYIDALLAVAAEEGVQILIPGGSEPMLLIERARDRFESAGVRLAMNAPTVVERLSDKAICFSDLERLGVRIPLTVTLDEATDWEAVPIPCVVKPSVDTGGSAFVFFAGAREDAKLYAAYLIASGRRPIAQEYMPHDTGGEFTVGVLSDDAGEVLGTIALKRAFPTKLSISASGRGFLISSGYSQGHIGPYEDVCATCRDIAVAVGSRGPMNIQGRIDASGAFRPFEINPRFSASTHLRAMAGFNEVDFAIRRMLGMEPVAPLQVRPGWYLRSLTEVFVPDAGLAG